MEIMLDTNVIISAALFPSLNMNAFLEKIIKEHSLVLCSYSLEELERVVKRKFPGKQRHVEIFLHKLPYRLIHTPTVNLLDDDYGLRDKADYPILLSAVTSDADILITGDRDFENLEIEKPEILTPSQFMKRY